MGKVNVALAFWFLELINTHFYKLNMLLFKLVSFLYMQGGRKF